MPSTSTVGGIAGGCGGGGAAMSLKISRPERRGRGGALARQARAERAQFARILNPTGWLTVVTFRRAIDEHRARTRAGLHDPGGGLARDGDGALQGADRGDAVGAAPHDIARELDERNKLRDLFEGLRLRLSA